MSDEVRYLILCRLWIVFVFVNYGDVGRIGWLFVIRNIVY